MDFKALGSISRPDYVEWKIKGFFSHSGIEDVCLYSPAFRSSNGTWYLEVCPHGETRNYSVGYVSIYLHKCQRKQTKCRIAYTLGIKASDGSHYKHVDLSNSFTDVVDGYGCARLINASKLYQNKSAVLSEGFITFFCIMHLPEKIMVDASQQIPLPNVLQTGCSMVAESPAQANVGGQNSLPVGPIPGVKYPIEVIYCGECRLPLECCEFYPNHEKCKEWLQKNLPDVFEQKMKIGKEGTASRDGGSDDISDDEGVDELTKGLTELYLNGVGCDITLRAGDKDFRAHRLILIIRSAVFSLQLQNNGQKFVEITECNPSVLHIFLTYLYTSKLQNISVELAIPLYVLAVRYDVPHLADKCVKYILHNFSVDCYCDILLLASEHKESKLLDFAEGYFEKNGLDIVSSSKWQSFLKTNGSIANGIFINFMKKLCARQNGYC